MRDEAVSKGLDWQPLVCKQPIQDLGQDRAHSARSCVVRFTGMGRAAAESSSYGKMSQILSHPPVSAVSAASSRPSFSWGNGWCSTDDLHKLLLPWCREKFAVFVG